MKHSINKITDMYGGIAYEDEASNELITIQLINRTYDTNLMEPWIDDSEGHARRIAGIIVAILQGSEFEINMWYRPSHPYVGNLYDGNHRLRAYQFLNKDISVKFSEE